MSLPEFVAPVVTFGGPATLIGVCLRYGSDAIVKLLAGIAVVFIRDEKHRESCLEALRILRRHRDDPPELNSPD